VTENEQKQQLSVAYVHAIAACAGYTCQVQNVDDDSVDVVIGARGYVHERAVLRSPRLDVQLKATSSAELKRDYLSFRLPVKNYDELRDQCLVPRLLVVLLLPNQSAEWLQTTEECMISRRCAYWLSLFGLPDTANTTTVSIRIPRSQPLDVAQLRGLMARASRKESL
jgi:hypothetical protein